MMKTTTFEAMTVPLEYSEHGVILLQNSRVSLDSIMNAYDEGATPEEIVYRFPTLRLESVYVVISYALQYPEFIRQYLQEQQQKREDFHQELKGLSPSDGLRKRLLQRKQLNGIS